MYAGRMEWGGWGTPPTAFSQVSVHIGRVRCRGTTSGGRTRIRSFTGTQGVVGDSVHAPSPRDGQGASPAIESAVQLARCLRYLPYHQALTAYEAERPAPAGVGNQGNHPREQQQDRLTGDASGQRLGHPNLRQAWRSRRRWPGRSNTGSTGTPRPSPRPPSPPADTAVADQRADTTQRHRARRLVTGENRDCESASRVQGPQIRKNWLRNRSAISRSPLMVPPLMRPKAVSTRVPGSNSIVAGRSEISPVS
jgi:hypothetical protein